MNFKNYDTIATTPSSYEVTSCTNCVFHILEDVGIAKIVVKYHTSTLHYLVPLA